MTRRMTLLQCASRLLPLLIVSSVAMGQLGQGGPSVTVDAVTETDGAHPGTALRAIAGVTLEQGWHVNANKPLDELLIPTILDITPPDGISVSAVLYPKPGSITSSFSTEPMAVYGGTFDIGIVLDVSASVAPGDYIVKGALKYQACNDTQCFPPARKAFTIPVTVRPAATPLTPQSPDRFVQIAWGDATAGPAAAASSSETPEATPGAPSNWRDRADKFEVVATTSGYQGAKAFLAFLAEADGNGVPHASGPFAGKSVWAVALLVLVGGALLNLTPCVLPLIPINLGIIGAGARAGSRKRGFALGGTYGLAIALVYGILGLVVILGVASTFGTLNATPAFNAAIAVIFIVLGLAMFDVILIDFTRFQTKLGLQKKRDRAGSFALAFFMGAVSALLAGACVAPVVISTVVYAQDLYSKGTTAALLLPFLLGVGMALPWPFAGAGLSFLPKPGLWMVRVKQVFGVLIFIFAAYYGYLAVTLVAERHAPSSGGNAAETVTDSLWTNSLDAGLEQAQREGKPVLIDFWATWCKNCTAMDETTFRNANVRQALQRFVPIKCQAEDPNAPETKAMLEHFGVLGLPTYVILAPTPDNR